MTKILVVDDDNAINELIKINLELQGYEVVQAFNGIEGFALAKQEEPSLIILDVMMPEVDGFTVAQRIRLCPEIAETPMSNGSRMPPILAFTAIVGTGIFPKASKLLEIETEFSESERAELISSEIEETASFKNEVSRNVPETERPAVKCGGKDGKNFPMYASG